MVVVMGATASDRQIEGVLAYLAGHHLAVRVSRGVERTIIVVLDEPPPGVSEELLARPGVERVVPIARPYKLASREYQPRETRVRLGDVEVGGEKVLLVAGLARLADVDRLPALAEAASAAGAHLLRVPAFQEATVPFGQPAWAAPPAERLARVRRAGLPVLAAVRSAEEVDACALLAQGFWVAGQDMHNAALLRRCIAARRPLVLERSPAATIDDWLVAADQVLAQGHAEVVLCEAGIRSFDQGTLDVSSLPLIRRLSHLPVIADPGRVGAGSELLEPLALAAVAAGAHGVAVEVAPPAGPGPPSPGGEPALTLDGLRRLSRRLARLSRVQSRLPRWP